MPVRWMRWIEKQRAEEQYRKEFAGVSTQTLTELYETLSLALKAIDENTDEWGKVYNTYCKIKTVLQHRKENENEHKNQT